MTEARSLLRLYGGHLAWCEARNCHIPGATKTKCNCGFYAAAYLAQPMTTCEGLTEKEQHLAEGLAALHLETGEEVLPSYIQDLLLASEVAVRSLAESRAREGELVAALEQVRDIAHEWFEEGRLTKESLDEFCAIGPTSAALAQGECLTCHGTRVAPSDRDLGGSGVTMSSCPDCVKA